jgi:hypothetical protein
MLRLRGLDASAIYELSKIEGGAVNTVSGADLMQHGLALEIPEKPGAVIIRYHKVQ